MWNPFDIIPKNMDSNIRLMIIGLVSVQFLAFIIWMGFLFNQYLEIRRKNREQQAQNSTNKDQVKQD
jgi:hypothetical protein